MENSNSSPTAKEMGIIENGIAADKKVLVKPNIPSLERVEQNKMRMTFPDGSFLEEGGLSINLLAAILVELKNLNERIEK